VVTLCNRHVHNSHVNISCLVYIHDWESQRNLSWYFVDVKLIVFVNSLVWRVTVKTVMTGHVKFVLFSNSSLWNWFVRYVKCELFEVWNWIQWLGGRYMDGNRQGWWHFECGHQLSSGDGWLPSRPAEVSTLGLCCASRQAGGQLSLPGDSLIDWRASIAH